LDSHRRLLLTSLGLGAGLAATSAAAASGTASPRASADARLTPDSGRDETLRLQQAIDAATAARRPLTLPPGRFRVSSLMLRPGTKLFGSGPETILEHMGGPSAIFIENATDVVLSDLSVTGGVPITGGRALIEAVGVDRLQLSGLTLTISPLNAIVLERCSGRIAGCTISHAAKAAIWSLDATGLEISHNTIADCANNGILVWRSSAGPDGTIVIANRIERIAAVDGGSGQNGNGINVFRAGGVIVSTNRITDCAYSAVRTNSASDVQIIANSAERIGEVALYAEFAFEGAVISGNLVDGAATGISVTNFNEGGRLAVVQGNVIRNLIRREGHPDVCGDGIAVEADASVTGNVVEGAPTTGIVIGFGPYCRDVVATSNIVRRCGIGIAVTAHADAGPILIAQNMITSARDGAIRTLDHGRPVGPDLARHAPTGRITLAANVVA
jgi:uncharacterized secreted repeat protein (TIGR03808 family)